MSTLGRDAFVSKYLDEMTGLLLSAYSSATLTQHKAGVDSYAQDGRFFIDQQRRARGLLGRMWDDLAGLPGPTEEPKKPNGQTAFQAGQPAGRPSQTTTAGHLAAGTKS